ncbi:MAG TPA: glycoside hydrolase family 20 zincin-like fold domain-containing protein [Phycisphaerae bacterium]|nr:glycoside hydrolase family 20 zincin-like fold domain-containing protein [Phycisphaerae bacterium]
MRFHVCFMTVTCMIVAMSPASSLADDVSSLRLIPFPKEVKLQEGSFTFESEMLLELPATQADLIGRLIHKELEARRLPRPKLQPRQDFANTLVLSMTPGQPKPAFESRKQIDEYTLQVTPRSIAAAAAEPAGLLCAVQTLCQLIRANTPDRKLPCLTIRDWASIRWRGFQDDITRGPSSTLEVLKREAAMGSALKMNLFAYYNEYQYAFEKHHEIGPKDGSLTAAELKELVAFAKPYGVDILGSQQSFGHMSRVLADNKPYVHLRENSDVLTPAKEETYQFLDDLYSEVIPLLPLPFFNVCCDEVDGLGQGPAKDMVAQLGPGGVYVKHMLRIHDLLKNKYGKRMMMWGDIILTHPDRIGDIPPDTIMLTWGYEPMDSFTHQIEPFSKSGFEFFVCPGVNGWNRILPDFGGATTNIRNFVRDGAKAGCLGVLNTAWDDNGETFNAPNWHGYAWGAECAWNASATDPADFNRRIGGVLFGEPGDHFGRAIDLLAKTFSLPGMNRMFSDRFFQVDFASSPADLKTNSRKLLEVVQPAIKHLKECQNQAGVNADLLDWFLFGAARMELIGRRMKVHADLLDKYEQIHKNPPAKVEAMLIEMQKEIRDLAVAHSALGRRFWELWDRENKPYARDWTMKKYEAVVKVYEDLADRIAQIRAEVLKNNPLPSARDAGLSQPTTKK